MKFISETTGISTLLSTAIPIQTFPSVWLQFLYETRTIMFRWGLDRRSPSGSCVCEAAICFVPQFSFDSNRDQAVGFEYGRNCDANTTVVPFTQLL